MKKNNLFFVYILLFLHISVLAEWKIDLSRRRENVRTQGFQEETSMKTLDLEQKVKSLGLLAPVRASDPVEEVVILNTETGFMPETVRVYEGKKYKVLLVNVNKKMKNVSFMMDSFSQYHSTYYGEVKSFTFSPSKKGVYYFFSPETEWKGQLIVHPNSTIVRSAASVEK